MVLNVLMDLGVRVPVWLTLGVALLVVRVRASTGSGIAFRERRRARSAREGARRPLRDGPAHAPARRHRLPAARRRAGRDVVRLEPDRRHVRAVSRRAEEGRRADDDRRAGGRAARRSSRRRASNGDALAPVRGGGGGRLRARGGGCVAAAAAVPEAARDRQGARGRGPRRPRARHVRRPHGAVDHRRPAEVQRARGDRAAVHDWHRQRRARDGEPVRDDQGHAATTSCSSPRTTTTSATGTSARTTTRRGPPA